MSLSNFHSYNRLIKFDLPGDPFEFVIVLPAYILLYTLLFLCILAGRWIEISKGCISGLLERESPWPKTRWLWILFILLGIGNLQPEFLFCLQLTEHRPPGEWGSKAHPAPGSCLCRHPKSGCLPNWPVPHPIRWAWGRQQHFCLTIMPSYNLLFFAALHNNSQKVTWGIKNLNSSEGCVAIPGQTGVCCQEPPNLLTSMSTVSLWWAISRLPWAHTTISRCL